MADFRYRIYTDQANNLIRVDLRGTLTRSGIMSAVSEARDLAHQEERNLLYDMRAMEMPEGILLSEILTFVRTHTRLNSEEATKFRSASLVVKQLLSDEVWELYQYASRNAGLQWEFFTEEEQAIDWLCAD